MMAHPSLKMFGLCEAMKWNHLPNPGGLYAQHPDMLEDFRFIFSERSKYEEEERKKEKAKQEREMKNSSRGGRGRRR